MPDLSIGVVDYHVGNVRSFVNMFSRIGRNAELVTDPRELFELDLVILPGVGAFDHGMSKLRSADFESPLVEYAATGKLLFGVCLGMQMLSNGSEEGDLPGLGLVPGYCKRLLEPTADQALQVPNMGWRQTHDARSHPLGSEGADDGRFYFTHTFHFVPESNDYLVSESQHVERFAAVVSSGNVGGAQFHPEKSLAAGMQYLGRVAGLAES